MGGLPFEPFSVCQGRLPVLPLTVRCRTAIHLAARSADAVMLKSLLENLAAPEKEKLVNQTDMFGITPLFLTLQKWVARVD